MKRKDDGLGFFRGVINSLVLTAAIWAVLWYSYKWSLWDEIIWFVVVLIIFWIGHYTAKGVIIYRVNKRRNQIKDEIERIERERNDV